MPRRTRAVLAFAVATALVACSDGNSTGVRSMTPTRPDPVTTVTPEIDEQIIALFPNGLETAAGVQWRNVTVKIDGGDRATGERMFWSLLDWMLRKSGRLDDPTGALTSQQALMKLTSDMYAYVFPWRERPPTSLSGDATFGIVTPDSAVTIVTPTHHAGVAFVAGSVTEPMLVTIDENPEPFREKCAGPLGTTLCQYPLFYRFEPYPRNRLLQPARFGVCHVNAGPFAPPEKIHDRFRLAHDAPAIPTPGGTLVEQIEILPLVSVADFMRCEDVSYQIASTDASINVFERGGLALARGLSAAARWAFVPRSAYAIDLGGGGESVEFSNFNVVDPVRPPDIDFEHFLDGTSTSPSCDEIGCDINDQYGPAGVLFDFTRFDGEPLGYVTLNRSANNPAGDAANHVATNARVIDGSGVWNGIIGMTFTKNPTSVTFLLTVNALSPAVPVNASGPTITGGERIPASQVTRTGTVVYPAGCTECVQFRQETITVTSATGISRITLPGGAFQLLIDDLTIR